MSNFSRRVNSIFDKDYTMFSSELKLVYDNIAKRFNIPDFNNLNLLIKIESQSMRTPYEVASTIEYRNNIYEVIFYKDAVNYALSHLKYNNNQVYKTRESVIRNAAAHEACHLALIQLHEDPIENGKHGQLFRSLYEPLRSKYTDAPFVLSYDGKKCNFTDEGDIMNIFSDDFSLSV